MVKVISHFKLDLTSTLYTYEMFEHLLMLVISILIHNHAVTTTNNVSDVGELTENVGHGRGCCGMLA
jgi:hypothetical protein